MYIIVMRNEDQRCKCAEVGGPDVPRSRCRENDADSGLALPRQAKAPRAQSGSRVRPDVGLTSPGGDDSVEYRVTSSESLHRVPLL